MVRPPFPERVGSDPGAVLRGPAKVSDVFAGIKLKYILIFSGFVVQYASQVSATDVYSTMDGFISLLVRDIHDWGLLLKKYNPLRTMVATSVDNKGRPILLPERGVQLPIGELLKTHFSSSRRGKNDC